MSDTPENPGKQNQPALVLLYGNGTTAQRRRALDRDAVILGRSRGCDFILEAPDVSSPHCIITRNPGGYTVRDCGSRAGTRLNGDPVHEARIQDGDLLQVGPFSFRVSLPPLKREVAQPGRESRQARLERKRRNLARLALATRQLLKRLRSAPQVSANDGDMAASAAALQERIRNYEQRFFRLDQAERDLTRDRQVFEQEQEEFNARVSQAELEMSRRFAELEAERQEPAGKFGANSTPARRPSASVS